uniref:Uncharacterized protein n=1 Tax=Arundo donax TaxID=35708 RepID=A0A0A9BD79_ARUDO
MRWWGQHRLDVGFHEAELARVAETARKEDGSELPVLLQ